MRHRSPGHETPPRSPILTAIRRLCSKKGKTGSASKPIARSVDEDPSLHESPRRPLRPYRGPVQQWFLGEGSTSDTLPYVNLVRYAGDPLRI